MWGSELGCWRRYKEVLGEVWVSALGCGEMLERCGEVLGEV